MCCQCKGCKIGYLYYQNLNQHACVLQTSSKLYLVLDFINGGHLFFQLYRQVRLAGTQPAYCCDSAQNCLVTIEGQLWKAGTSRHNYRMLIDDSWQ